MQEVYLKNFIIFKLFYLHREFQLQVLWICALAWYCPKHHHTAHTHTHTHTHTHILYFNTSLTTFFFTPLAIHMQHHHELRKTIVC